MTPISSTSGAVVRFGDLLFKSHDGFEKASAVGPEIGAEFVRLDVIRLAASQTWTVPDNIEEYVVVVFSGSGLGAVAGDRTIITRGSTMHAPTGLSLSVRADENADMMLYIWRSTLLEDRQTSANPQLFGSLWDDKTQLRNFAGTGQVDPTDRIATMNFIHWPGTGSAQLCLHCGIQQPGETFSVHLHEVSEDAFIAFEGDGQMYLQDRWMDVSEGDILFARPRVLHGARHPRTGRGLKRFVTCGGPTPFDTFLYQAAGVSAQVR